MVSPTVGQDRDGQLVGWEAEIGSWKLSLVAVFGLGGRRWLSGKIGWFA